MLRGEALPAFAQRFPHREVGCIDVGIGRRRTHFAAAACSEFLWRISIYPELNTFFASQNGTGTLG